MNNWEKLCTQITPLINGNVSEEIYHSVFVSCLKTIFNWTNNSIKDKLSVHMGSTPKEADIVLEGIDFNIVIEMKQPNLTLGRDHVAQLISYMRVLGCKYGFLIGNQIKMFYDYDQSKKPNEIDELIAFNFNINNEDGIELGNILDHSICTSAKLYEFSKIKLESLQKKHQIKNLKKDLIANNYEKIKNILTEKLSSDGLEKEIVKNILDDIFKQVNSNISENQNAVERPLVRNVSNDGFQLEFIPSDENVFKQRLIETKRAKRTWYYPNNRTEEDFWNVNIFNEESGLRGNIYSQPRYREKGHTGLYKIKLEIID